MNRTTSRTKTSSPSLDFEHLEERRCLAFGLNFVDGLMQIGQRADDGDVTVTLMGDRIEVTDSSGTRAFDTQMRHQLYLLGHSSTNVIFDFKAATPGDFQVDLRDGDRTVLVKHSGDPIEGNILGGSLNITGRRGSQEITLDSGDEYLQLNGLTLEMGDDMDTLNFTGNWGVNSKLDFQNTESISADGSLNINLFGTDTDIEFTAFPVAGDLYFSSGLGNDTVILPADVTFGGYVDIETNGGNDTIRLGSSHLTESMLVRTGFGDDNVTIDSTSVDLNLVARMGFGNDTFTFQDGATPVFVRVDFQEGNGRLINNFAGTYDFGFRVFNLNGFQSIYDPATGNLDLQQSAITDNVLVDDGGPNGAIRFGVSSGEFTEMSTLPPAADFRLLLLPDTGEAENAEEVTVDFDNPRIGNTTLQLRDATNLLQLTGDSNTYEGLLRIEAADGAQTVNLAVNAPLNVSGTVVVNTRDDSDALLFDHDVTVGESLLLRGVNSVEYEHQITTGENFNVITVLENETTRLTNVGLPRLVTVGGNFNYIGGNGLDVIDFADGGAVVTGYSYINVAESDDLIQPQTIRLHGSFETESLFVVAETASAGNDLSTDDSTLVRSGLFVADFTASNSQNSAKFYGNYNGGYATYRGGSASDSVTIKLAKDDLEFVAITGDGNDSLTVESPSDLDFLFADFGAGNDSLDDSAYADGLPFDSYFIGL